VIVTSKKIFSYILLITILLINISCVKVQNQTLNIDDTFIPISNRYEKMAASVSLIIESEHYKNKNFSIGSKSVANFYILPAFKSNYQDVNAFKLTKYLFESSFKQLFSTVYLNDGENISDFICKVTIVDDNLEKTTRKIKPFVLYNRYDSTTVASVNYNINCSSSKLNKKFNKNILLNFYNKIEYLGTILDEISTEISKAFESNISEFEFAILNPNHKGEGGIAPLHYYTIKGNKEALEGLLSKGANINITDDIGDTPLHYAARYSSIDVFAFLLQHGGDINKKNNNGETPEEILVLRNIEEIDTNDDFVNKLSKLHIDYLKYKNKILPIAIINKYSKLAALLKESGAKLDEIGNLEATQIIKSLFPQYQNLNITISNKGINYLEIDGKLSDIGGIYLTKKHKFSKLPFKEIEKTMESALINFLKLNDKPYKIPPVVEAPKLPAPIKLEKGKFESTQSFRKRIEKAQKRRQEEILRLQDNYRKKVEERNRLLKSAEELAMLRFASEEIFKKVLMRDILTSIFVRFSLDKPQYDPDTTNMFVDLKAVNADFKKRIALKVPEGEYAESFYYNTNKITPLVIFKYDGKQLELADVKTAWQDKICSINFDAVNFTKSEPMEVVIKENIKFNPISQKQNPNLIDTSSINIIVYEKSRDKYKDDLPELLAKAKVNAIKADHSKWLFAIGAEHYDNTDPVLYSARSAEMFVKIATEVLGVPKSNVYSFIGDKASAGAIKSGLKRLIQNVAKGDTIYFYYSGHGIPVLPGNDPYILPKDVVPDFIADEQDFKLQNIYNLLSETKASKILAFIDSCFSGATDGESVFKGVAASRLKPKEVTFDTSKMVVITAGKNSQFSNMYEDKGHRLFSYFVMKSILKGRREINTLYNEVFLNVKDTSFSTGGDNRKQEPTIKGNLSLSL